MASQSSGWTALAPIFRSLLRIVAGLLFMQHGANKLFGVLGGSGQIIDTASLMSLHGLAGILEFFGGLLIVLGLWTRPVAFVLSGEMAFAYFLAHFPANHVFPLLNGGGLAVIFCFTFLYLSAAGAGPWSLDHWWRRRG